MKNIKKHILLGIMFIFSQSVFADTCYDPAANSVPQPHWRAILSTSYIYKNLQGWETKGWSTAGNEISADSMTFVKASYSPNTGLLCIYQVNIFNVINFPPGEGNVTLHPKQEQYIESDFIDHVGWQKMAVTHAYQCINNNVNQCVFKTFNS